MSYNIFNVAKDLIMGNLKYSTPELAAERLALCDGCEAQNKTLRVCTACSCHIPTKVKLLDSSCPMELW